MLREATALESERTIVRFFFSHKQLSYRVILESVELEFVMFERNMCNEMFFTVNLKIFEKG